MKTAENRTINKTPAVVADFHSHILPGIDDGSASVDESLAMLRAAWEQGITRMVATPHFYAHMDTLPGFVQRRQEAWARLHKAMAGSSNLPRVHLGAEVYYFPGIGDCESLEPLALRDTPYILIEMPMAKWTDSMYRDLEGIYRKQGLIPIVAHVDRYLSPLRTRGIPERLAELPVLVQANASFFLRLSTRGMALRMLKNGRIHLLGSDCHNMDSRPPCLGGALDIIAGKLGIEALDAICRIQDKILP